MTKMKHPKSTSDSVLITHIVNPHQFYYKYTNQIANDTFSKFDFDIQLYANKKYAEKTHENGYVPKENELVIFFNLIFNKWIRGRVISVGQEITFWCIDNGVWEKLFAPHVLPLEEHFHRDLNLVQLGGLSLLPTEKTWNELTEEVETQLSKEWDQKSTELFKGIICTSKTFTFTEEFELEGHKFGSLAIESKTANRKEINQIFVEMNNAAHSHRYTDEDLWSYVHDAQLKIQLCKSILHGSSIRIANSNNSAITMKPSVHRTFLKYGSEVSIENLAYSEYSDDSLSRQSSVMSTILPSETVSYASGRKSDAECDEDSKPAIAESQGEVLQGISGSASSTSFETTIAHEDSKPAIAESQGEVLQGISGSASSTSFETTIAHEDSKPAIAESQGEVLQGISGSASSTSFETTIANSMMLKENLSPNRSKFSSEECYLRTCRRDDTENVRQQPLPSTMHWIKSMMSKSCATSTINSNENRATNQISPIPSTTAKASRRDILAELMKKGSAADTTTVKNSATNAPNSLYGVPAGFAKNCLSTFGGMNRKNVS